MRDQIIVWNWIFSLNLGALVWTLYKTFTDKTLNPAWPMAAAGSVILCCTLIDWRKDAGRN